MATNNEGFCFSGQDVYTCSILGCQLGAGVNMDVLMGPEDNVIKPICLLYWGAQTRLMQQLTGIFFFFYPFHEKVYLWPHDGTILPQCILTKTSRNSQILEVWEARERIISYCRQRIRIQEPVEKKMNKVYTVILVGLVVCCSEY